MVSPVLVRWFTFALALAVSLCVPARSVLQAHEIPERVALTVFVRAEDGRVRVLVRVPLEAMRDVLFPQRGDGTLVLEGIEPLLDEAAGTWLVPALPLWADGVPLGAPHIVARRLSRPSDRSFARWEDALVHLGTPAPGASPTSAWPDGDSAPLTLAQALFDVLLEVSAPAVTPASRLTIEPALAHLGVRTVSVLRSVHADGSERTFTYTGDPGRVELDPRWWQAARTFVALGFEHILEGIDHLLFVCCLVIPVRRWRSLVAIVSAFTVAHSLTLATAAMGIAPDAAWFPPLVETLIAASIVYMAAENVLRPADALAQRWKLAFAFGLVHGFGFSFALGESLQFAGSHLVASLAAFNLGVELGQLAVLAVVVPVLSFVFARVARPFVLVAVLSALVGHSAWHWMTERGAELLEQPITVAAPSLVVWLGVLRFALLVAVSVAVAWGLSGVFGRLSVARSQ